MYYQSSGFRWNCYTLKGVLPCTPHKNTRESQSKLWLQWWDLGLSTSMLFHQWKLYSQRRIHLTLKGLRTKKGYWKLTFLTSLLDLNVCGTKESLSIASISFTRFTCSTRVAWSTKRRCNVSTHYCKPLIKAVSKQCLEYILLQCMPGKKQNLQCSPKYSVTQKIILL